MLKNFPNKFKVVQINTLRLGTFFEHHMAKSNIVYYKYLPKTFNFLKGNI